MGEVRHPYLLASRQCLLTSSCCGRADADGNGDLDRDEMALVLKQMGREVDDAGLDEIIREVDKDGDGQIDFSEFEAWWFGMATADKVRLLFQRDTWDDNFC